MSPFDLADAVAREANLESAEEAVPITQAVTGSMADHFEPDAWVVIRQHVPSKCLGSSQPASESGTVKEFFTDIGDRANLGSAEAARYARIVAEAIRGRMSDVELRRLQETLSEDFLALFEAEERGEMTGSPGPTEGSERLGTAGQGTEPG